MTLESHEQYQYQEDQIPQKICWNIAFLKILVFDMTIQNQILIDKEAGNHLFWLNPVIRF